MKFQNLRVIWTESKNLSLPDLLSRSLTSTIQHEHHLRTVEIPDFITFIMTHNQHTQPVQSHYAISKEYIDTIATDTNVESPHFPKYLHIRDNYFKVQLENDLYLPVSNDKLRTKTQPLEHIHLNKTQLSQHFHPQLETYLIVQHTDVTLNKNKTEPFTPFTQKANYAERIYSIKFSPPAMDGFIPKSP